MNILLLAFAIPLATILLSIVLQKVLRNPFLVAATIFSILLILTFTVVEEEFRIYALALTIAYTLLSFITAYIVRLICEFKNCRCNNLVNTISANQAIADNTTSNNNGCGCNTSNSQAVSLSANITPDTINNGTTGRFRGRYRRGCR